MQTTISSLVPEARSVKHLPYDILSPDLVSLLCSCRAMHSLVNDQPTWRALSIRYGLQDVRYFGGRSWYIIYTRLLHTYGPMLGLWAGDDPYTGRVIEVNLDAGNPYRQGGIIVQMWRFRVLQPEDVDDAETAELPTYTTLATIDFTATTTQYGLPKVTCCCDKRATAHRAWLQLMSPNCSGFFLHARGGRYPHPDFPNVEANSWVDVTRYPRLPCTPSNDIDQTAHLPPHSRIFVVYTAPTHYWKPPAVTLSCEQGCIDRARPFLGFEVIGGSIPRFYPLRHKVAAHIDPTSTDWHPALLEGVWLGSHGPHGTECLYLDLTGHPATLRAWKITGDENVPRGALTWYANMESPLTLLGARRELCVQCLGMEDVAECRFFEGAGTISRRGYMPHQRDSLPVILVVCPEHLLRVVWIEVEEVSVYIRYTRRHD
ncbi:hypothetical protein BC628DRAFT_1411555 [Trametes gibbosa]|nr:hypothetical protein BC628DRAFT_1411555 [Trametes gibbosa]